MTDPKDGQDPTPARKGGFGAFSQQYRDRWDAGHPKATRAGAQVPPVIGPPAEEQATPQADGADPDATTQP